ncbi:hypothetical protein ACPVPU_07345 [Sphingomonas sp. CJ99]
MTYASEVASRRRLQLLQLIIQDGGQANDGSLLTAMRSIGERQAMDQAALRQLLRDLEQRDCLTLDMIRDTVMVARVTERGRMVAAGDTEVGGVHNPLMGL